MNFRPDSLALAQPLARAVVAITLLALAAGASLAAHAADEHAGHGAMHAVPGSAQTSGPMADGVVKKVDAAAARVTIAHGALPNGMPPMTMAFAVKDPTWLTQLKEGNKIRFAVDTVNGTMTVVGFERAK